MKLKAQRCYEAVCQRDTRFDGRFFTGVKTTGIYCRPVCPARTPRRDSCRFFASAGAAQMAGFRACKRCRPDRQSDYSRVDIVRRVAQQVRQRILDGALDQGGVEDLAREFGYSSRQLRRALKQSAGVTPVQLAQQARAARAQRLLKKSQAPMSEIARAAGFKSIRRFNRVITTIHGRPPRQLRQDHAHD